MEGEDLLTQFLQEKGYLEAPVDEVKIEIPADTEMCIRDRDGAIRGIDRVVERNRRGRGYHAT